MHIAYIDESGDSGDVPSGGSRTYALGAVLVPAAEWADTFDELVKFRRYVRDTFGVPMRAEVKANWLLRGSGDLRPLKLNQPQRRAVYRLHLKFLHWNSIATWAVVIEKPADRPPRSDVAALAWETMFQRLERFSQYGGGPCVICHDEGDNKRIRRLARQRRRFGTSGGHFGGALRNDFRLMVDDPVPKDSAASYFVQLADLVAYSAFRSVQPQARSRRTQIVDQATYGLIGDGRNLKAAGLSPRHSDESIVLRSDV